MPSSGSPRKLRLSGGPGGVSWKLTRDKGQPDQLVGALKANNSLQRLARHLFGCLAWQLDPQHHGILEKTVAQRWGPSQGMQRRIKTLQK
jgi:hypothetical protein